MGDLDRPVQGIKRDRGPHRRARAIRFAHLLLAAFAVVDDVAEDITIGLEVANPDRPAELVKGQFRLPRLADVIHLNRFQNCAGARSLGYSLERQKPTAKERTN